jgi:hypothetical protein
VIADHCGGLGQRQRKVPQVGGDRCSSVQVLQTGPTGQVGHRLRGREQADLDAHAEPCKCPVSARDHHLDGPHGRQERGQAIGVGGIVEHDQCRAGEGLQVAPHVPGGDRRVAVIVGDTRQDRDAAEAGQQLVLGLGRHPGHQGPPRSRPGPGVRGGRLSLSHPRPTGDGLHDTHPRTRIPCARQIRHCLPLHEGHRPSRDLPGQDLPGTARPNTSRASRRRASRSPLADEHRPGPGYHHRADAGNGTSRHHAVQSAVIYITGGPEISPAPRGRQARPLGPAARRPGTT